MLRLALSNIPVLVRSKHASLKTLHARTRDVHASLIFLHHELPDTDETTCREAPFKRPIWPLRERMIHIATQPS